MIVAGIWGDEKVQMTTEEKRRFCGNADRMGFWSGSGLKKVQMTTEERRWFYIDFGCGVV